MNESSTLRVNLSEAALAREAVSPADRTRPDIDILGKSRILEMIATGSPLHATLDALLRFVESQERGLRCSLLLVTEDGEHFRRGSGPSLPEVFHAALDGVPITPPYLGSCGESAHRCAPIVVRDVASETRYTDRWRELMLACGLRSVRSTPICGSVGRALGCFAFYYDHPRNPDPANPELIEIATHLASIAIERHRSEQEMCDTQNRLAAELAGAQHLQEISTLLIKEHNVTALYEKAVDAAVAIMRADYGSIQLLEAEPRAKNGLRLLAFRGFNEKAARFWQWVPVDSDSTCGAALRTGKRVIETNVETNEARAGSEHQAMYLDTGIRAAQSTPLMSRAGRLVGIISTHWSHPHEPDERDLRRLDILARIAADLIERAQAENALRESEEFKQRLIESSRDCMKVVDTEGRLLWINGSGCQLLGIDDPNSLLGESWVDYWPEASRKAARDAVRAAAEGGLGEFSGWCPTRTGVNKWWDNTLSPIKGVGGKPDRILAVSRDMTHQRHAEDRQALLINELNHRVKNTLATVQSLATQTLRSTELSSEAWDLLDSRLAALAGAHDILTNQSWEGANLSEVVSRAVAPFRNEAHRWSIDGPDARLTPKQALAISITLHELATNALKHGAFSNNSGRVRIAWRVLQNGNANDSMELSWREQGGPKVSPPTRKGFGSRLIERGLAHELEGEASIDYRPEGVVCIIKSPLTRMRAEAAAAASGTPH